MRYRRVAYRAHDPRWAFSPLSGDGAKRRGGRFNPQGVPALYLSTSEIIALGEYHQGFPHRPQPMTLCAYEVDCTDIIDLTVDGERKRARTTLTAMASGWELLFRQGGAPPTWDLACRLINDGVAGILVPSYAPNNPADGKNLVLWDWGNRPPHQVSVIDDHGKLPRNQDSWSK